MTTYAAENVDRYVQSENIVMRDDTVISSEENFTQHDASWAVTTESVYFVWKKVSDLDPVSFVFYSMYYVQDKNWLYYVNYCFEDEGCTESYVQLQKIDVAQNSLETNWKYAKSTTKMYYKKNTMPLALREWFKVIHKHYTKNDFGVYRKWLLLYWATSSTFKYLWNDLAKDHNTVFLRWFVQYIPWLDIKNLALTHRRYADDGKNIYCLWDMWLVKMSVDYDTFVVSETNNTRVSVHATDAYNEYSQCKKV